MAISMDFMERKVFSNGEESITQEVEHKKAYWCITTFDGDKSRISFRVDVFEDVTKTRRLFGYMHEFTPSIEDGAKNFVAQAYLYLKTLPEFAGAIDC